MTERLGGYKVHPAAAAFPLLNQEELVVLAEDIRQNGLLEPIMLDNDGEILIDGRNRLKACKLADVEPTFRHLAKSYTELDTIRFIVSKNVKRRHLNSGQRAMIALDVKPLYAAAAKERMQLSEGRGKKGAQSSGHLTDDRTGRTDRQLGELFGTSHDSIARAAKIADASPDLADKVRDGELSSNDAYKQARAKDKAAPEDKPKETKPQAPMISLKDHTGKAVAYPKPAGKSTFNQTNDQVSWSRWTWNPVTGCLHGCRYCYARELAVRPSYRASYPIGFEPLFHHERLEAPANTAVPGEANKDPRLKRVFVCSMADLYGKWVPNEWIEQVHASCIANPQWDYLMLTKFPRRYVGMQLPATAWLGTSVDEQKRVRLAEEAFREIKGVRVKWLSLEPLLAPLEFTDLSMFDWVVIGSQSATEQPDGHVAEFAPPFEWVSRLVDQAREAGCRVYLKPNLVGNVHPQSPGMVLPQEEPEIAVALKGAA